MAIDDGLPDPNERVLMSEFQRLAARVAELEQQVTELKTRPRTTSLHDMCFGTPPPPVEMDHPRNLPDDDRLSGVRAYSSGGG